MANMLLVDNSEAEALSGLGERLKRRRLERNDRQSDAAARLGVSLATYRKMEAGNASIPIGYWLRMIRLYDDLKSLNAVFAEKKSLFDRLESEKQAINAATRKRAKRR